MPYSGEIKCWNFYNLAIATLLFFALAGYSYSAGAAVVVDDNDSPPMQTPRNPQPIQTPPNPPHNPPPNLPPIQTPPNLPPTQTPPVRQPSIIPGGPTIPYISGRLGPAQATSAPPIGLVVPDDFCLPGKFDDCGDHLRDSADFSPVPVDGPIFVGRNDTAFARAQSGVWINGQSRQTDLSYGTEQRSLTAISIGGDRRVGQDLAIGVMVVSNNRTTDFSATGISDIETGIQVGPYFAYRLSENLILDGRLVYGVADHTVETANVNTGQFQSRGGFGALRLSGTFDRGNWRLHPSLELASVFQDNDGYVDTLRGPIAAESLSDTFATVAILAYYNQLSLGNGTLDPYVGFEATQPIGGGSAFATIRAGLALTMGNGAVLNLDYANGAIGLSGTEDQLISLRLEIPL